MHEKILIIGVGNEYRGDDNVGLVATKLLCESKLTGVSLTVSDGEGMSLIERWRGYSTVIIVDAFAPRTLPGTIHVLEASRNSISHRFFLQSTHSFGVSQAIELARELQILPDRLFIIGIEGKDFTMGVEGLSDEVVRALPELKSKIIEKVEELKAVPAA